MMSSITGYLLCPHCGEKGITKSPSLVNHVIEIIVKNEAQCPKCGKISEGTAGLQPKLERNRS